MLPGTSRWIPKFQFWLAAIAEMSVKQHRRQPADRTIEVRDAREGVRIGGARQRNAPAAEEVIDRVQRISVVVLLERRIAARVAEKVAEDAVVENAVTAADAVLPSFQGPRRNLPAARCWMIVGVKLVSGPRSHQGHRDRELVVGSQSNWRSSVLFVGNTVELVA